ncbi:MAG: hypothetical protein ABSA10_08915 [Anaerolineales bacterium]|jgi:hypothetical protein
MPGPVRTLLRLTYDLLGECYLSAAFWIVLACYVIIAPHAPPLPALEFTIGFFFPVYFLAFLGIFPVVGQVIYLAIARPVVLFLSGGANNPLLAASWKIPAGLERILGPFSGAMPMEGTVLSFIVDAGFWLSVILSLMVIQRSAARFLLRVWPPAPKTKPPVEEAAPATGFFERCQPISDKVLFSLMGLALLGSAFFAASHNPVWEGIFYCGLAVLAALLGGLLFSLVRIPPGSGFVIYALVMPGILRMILSGVQDFSPPVFAAPWFGPGGGIVPPITLVGYAIAAGWLWMIYLLLHRALGIFQSLFPRAWAKPRPIPQAASQSKFAGWKSRLATWTVVLLSLGGVAVIIWSTVLGEDYRHPIVYSFGDLTGTMVCIEHCEQYGGQGALLPKNPPPGTPRTVVVRLDATSGPLFLRIEPRRQDRLAFIDLSIGLEWINPEGKIVARIDPQDRFPGSELTEYWFYRKDIAIPALESGNYTLVVTPYDNGVAWIAVSIRKNP